MPKPIKVLELGTEYGISFGGILCLLSTIINPIYTCNLKISNSGNFHLIKQLKSILKISDSDLLIEFSQKPLNDFSANHQDRSKILSPYFSTNTVQLFGKDFSVAATKKQYIGLVMANGTDSVADIYTESTRKKSFPHNRYAQSDSYDKIIKLIFKSGYDLITFNTNKSSLESKIYNLLYCRAVIGYDGGLAHLCHILKIPFIMLPWTCNQFGNSNGFNIITNDGVKLPIDIKYITHQLHLDKRTHFLESEYDIYDLTQEDLEAILKNLENEKGNNIFLNDTPLANRINSWARNKILDTFAPTESLREIIDLFNKDVFLGGIPVNQTYQS